MNRLSQARALYGAGRHREAATLLGELLRQEPANSAAMQLLGAIQYQAGYKREGLKLAERAVASEPSNAEAWNSLGLMRHLEGDDDAAMEAFERATEARADYAEAWRNKGFLLQSRQHHAEALQAFDMAGRGLDFAFFRANSYAALGLREQAVGEYDRILKAQPENGEAWHNRGTSLLALGRSAEALDSLQKALKYMGRGPLPLTNTAIALFQSGRADEGLAIIDQVLREHPEFEQAKLARIDIVAEIEGLEAAAHAAETAGEDRAGLARTLQAQGKWRLAVRSLAKCTSPGDRFLEALLMPAIFESSEMAAEALHHLETSVASLRDDPPHLDDPHREVGTTTFHLPYFGVSDRPYQESIVHLYREAAPILRFETAHGLRAGRKKLGVISATLYEHTISRVYGGLVERLNPERFEVTFLQIGRSDSFSERIARSAQRHVRLPESLPEAQEIIAREELDLIFYPELGINPLTYYLSMCRLAPVQVTTWGHPFTSGSPVIDHFISSIHLEREDGQAEYTESLALLPSVMAYYARPEPPPRWERSDFGLPEQRRLYGCLQMAYKFHPDYDRALSALVEQDEKGVIVLIEPQHPHYRRILIERWQKRYPRLVDRVAWVPPLPIPNYLRLAQLCDALVAPIQFGGGRSTLDAFGVGAPVVTYKGEFLKSRISYALYREIGVEGCVAESEAEYVGIALRLARDSDWQAEMRSAIGSKSSPLFESRAAVRELNDLLAKIVEA